ncbi:hypothetical protein CDAR_19771 [Caerostris darwini]|uniref:Uncharacterized protein n=1 Tax=Caerostris darwini TaxID=1538125 RepID=A0AAV4U9C2_9ARAC|nr:hypothetical protein CDAR_19771 [Caerostris darwini]
MVCVHPPYKSSIIFSTSCRYQESLSETTRCHVRLTARNVSVTIKGALLMRSWFPEKFRVSSSPEVLIPISGKGNRNVWHSLSSNLEMGKLLPPAI